ncbi:MAG: 1-deoxy-D-xylulose-5-phosphate reductoisomerase [Candidatus Omnitrophota bacterium]
MRRSVTILGSTGSVGVNTLRVIREHPDAFEVRGLAAGSRAEALEEQVREFSPKGVYLKDPEAARRFTASNGRFRIFSEKEGLAAFSDAMDADILVAATTGSAALLPVLRALEKGRRVALANKEILVAAGGLVMAALKRNPQASLIPVDSEHNAVFQCLEGHSSENVERLILTGSGGPLREVPQEKFLGISKEAVINHPRWKMGRKISVDSATLMNKGLEIIEASWLFGFPIDKIDVLIHPEAVIHSMIELRDGSLLAQLGVTDMRLPIQHALSFPARLPASAGLRLDLAGLSQLTFFQPDRAKFPCLDLACGAARQSGSAPCVLSAADETAVDAYLNDKIRFVEIPRIIENVLSRHRHVADPGLEEIQSIHDWAVEETKKLCQAR